MSRLHPTRLTARLLPLYVVHRFSVALVCIGPWVPGCEKAEPSDSPADVEVELRSEEDPSLQHLPPDDVLFSLRHKESEARRCFALVDGRLRGIARFSWKVGVDGSVSEVELQHSTTGVSEVDKCLQRFVEDLHYDRREAPARATWTFVHGLADLEVLARASERKQPRGGRSRKDDNRFNGAVIEEGSPGKLDTSDIEDVAEHGFRLYAFCMRDGLNRDAHLSGRVLLSFTIDPEGRVRRVTDVGSDLPDLRVIDCVAQSFYALRFPKPSGGVLRLRYSILLNEE